METDLRLALVVLVGVVIGVIVLWAIEQFRWGLLGMVLFGLLVFYVVNMDNPDTTVVQMVIDREDPNGQNIIMLDKVGLSRFIRAKLVANNHIEEVEDEEFTPQKQKALGNGQSRSILPMKFSVDMQQTFAKVQIYSVKGSNACRQWMVYYDLKYQQWQTPVGPGACR